MDNNVLADLRPLISAWKTPQIKLPQVVRWAKYLNSGVRRQDSVQHSHAITILCVMVIAQISAANNVELDEGLLLSAFAVHDVGEGELGWDTLYIDKTAEEDLAEYLAFRKCYEMLGPAWRALHVAFLLQFCLKNPEIFPADAREIMEYLATMHRYEALAFDAIERWDSFLYAAEQFMERGHEKILVQMLRNNLLRLNALATELPGFATIWTPELSVWASAFLKQREGNWIEGKGER